MPSSKAAALSTKAEATPINESPSSPVTEKPAASMPSILPSNNKKKKSPKKEKRMLSKSGSKGKKLLLGATTIPSRAAEHEAGNSFMDDHEKFHEAMLMLDSIEGRELSTEETSDALSSVNSTISSEFGHYEVVEYDLSDPDGPFYTPDNHFNGSFLNLSPTKDNKMAVSDPSQMPFPDLDLVIQDDSPAAEALRANANVHVSSASKAARAVHLQSIRRFAKFAAGANKTGYVKGKPPRLPPAAQRRMDGPFGGPSKSISEGEESIEEDDEECSDDDNTPYVSGEEDIKDSGAESDVDAAKVVESIDDKVAASASHPLDPAPEIDDSSLQKQLAEAKQRELDDAAAAGHMLDGVAPGTIEAGRKVLGNVDPHDLLKLQRWRKKDNARASVTKSYVKGKVINGEHELYTLSIAVMIGVRQSISRTNVELNAGNGKRWVKIQDFRTTEKYEFRPKGDGKTPPHLLAHTFKFKDYSPVVFAYLRRMYGVNEFDFLLSVCGNANFIEFISNAKSGQFFFYSSDGRYMIKTMTNAESKFLRRILPQYFKHCCENPNTIMTRFFGMYRVKLYHLRRNVKFVIMNSVYYTDKPLQSFYDLKGSAIGRDAKPGQAVLKDNDLRRSLPEGAMALKSDQCAALRNQVAADCEFLQQVDIMDYSMLVGVHHIPLHYRNFRGNNHNRLDKQLKAVPQRGVGKGGKNSSLPSDSTMPGETSTSPTETDNDVAPSRSELGYHHRRKPSLKNFSFDDGLDDDDSSYLLGSTSHPHHTKCIPSNVSVCEDTERKKVATIEKLYWPFHLWFDIHGYRRLVPLEAPYNNRSEEDEKILRGYNIPKFAAPPSDRKDGGFDMDTTNISLPLTVKEQSGHERHYDGKIFYMGIIDILQEYTARKSLETTYRSFLNGKGSTSQVSCVPPPSYADRFLRFFEEYTKPIAPKKIENSTSLSEPVPGVGSVELPNLVSEQTEKSVELGSK